MRDRNKMQERTGDEDSAPKHHGTLGKCWYLFQRETSLRRTQSETLL